MCKIGWLVYQYTCDGRPSVHPAYCKFKQLVHLKAVYQVFHILMHWFSRIEFVNWKRSSAILPVHSAKQTHKFKLKMIFSVSMWVISIKFIYTAYNDAKSGRFHAANCSIIHKYTMYVHIVYIIDIICVNLTQPKDIYSLLGVIFFL